MFLEFFQCTIIRYWGIPNRRFLTGVFLRGFYKVTGGEIVLYIHSAVKGVDRPLNIAEFK